MVTTSQVWTLIGALVSLLVALVTVGVGSVRQQLRQQADGLNHQFDAVNRRFDDLRSELSVRFDRLDGDVQALTNKVFRDG
jgi:predicted PurR-regulated permease PerM